MVYFRCHCISSLFVQKQYVYLQIMEIDMHESSEKTTSVYEYMCVCLYSVYKCL